MTQPGAEQWRGDARLPGLAAAGEQPLQQGGQTVITTTTAAAFPLPPSQSLVVANGEVREA